MPLTRVTISGADDGVEPAALFDLSRKFPFVEWGVLFSHKRAGREPRYPGPRWLTAIEWYFKDDARFALHLCGQASRDVMAKPSPWLKPAPTFARVQLNGWAPGLCDTKALARFAREHGTEFILQARYQSVLRDAAREAAAIGGASVLFDPSGGRGIAPTLWPEPPIASVRMGYAGGIGPDNVDAVIHELFEDLHFACPFWIDMESGVRDAQDRFDLDRVQAVLEAAAPAVTVDDV